MMKKFKFASVAALLVCSILLFTGCSSFGAIKKAFEGAEYKYSQNVSASYSYLTDEAEEMGISVTMHSFTKGLNLAIVIEFGSTKDLLQYVAESEELKTLIKDLNETDFVNMNCVLVPVGLNPSEMIELFKNA